MIIAALLVLGLFALRKLNVDLYPDVDMPFVVVTTVLSGAGPEQIETDVTKKIEDAVNPISGVKHIQSASQESASIVVIEFNLSVDGKTAAQEVREKVAAVRGDLPDNIEDPVIQRYDPASLPIITMTISGKRPEREITAYTKNIIKKRFENISGVGSVNLVGGAEREVEVTVKADRLRAYDLSIDDVIQAVGMANVEIPGGSLTKGDRQINLRTMGKFISIDGFNNIVVATPGGKIIYLSDVADVSDGIKEKSSLTRLNGDIAVGIEIRKQSGSNTVEVAKEINAQLAKIRKELPLDIKITVAHDYSIYIEDSVNAVFNDLRDGAILAVIVIFLFLANGRATMISALALPTSIIASFFMMYMLGFTMNMMSLLALSLAVGLLIDDAIVVVENIYRHMANGETAAEAAKTASDEIGLAVLATTFTLVAVFIPVAFMPGIVGRYFYEFGLTISAAVLVSLLVAFTLTPMLSARWLKAEDERLNKSGNIFQKSLYYFNHFFEILSSKYRVSLRWTLRHRWIAVLLSTTVFVVSFFLMGLLGNDFFPDQDEGEFNVAVNAAPGSSLEQTDNICRQVEKILRSRNEVVAVTTTIGSGNDPVTKASMLVKLTKKKERRFTYKEIIADFRLRAKSIAGARISFNAPGGEAGNEKPIALSVRGESIAELVIIADKVKDIVERTSGAVDVESSLETSKPEVRLMIDRQKASDLGISTYAVASGVRAMVDGYVATQYQEGNEQYDVRVRLNKEDRTSFDNIQNMTIKSYKKINDNKDPLLVRLTDIARISQDVGPSTINRYDRQKEIKIEANLSDKTLGEVLQPALKKSQMIPIPAGYSINVAGMGEIQSESFGDIFVSLALAVIFVYIVLASQFESFILPFSIMLALPMSLIGAVLGLLIFGSSISIVSLIGIILLMGLVTKNGILLVDYTNVLRKRGLSRFDALVEAGPVRLRPILMTTFAMVFGMAPIAFGISEGSEFRAPMGQAVIGGLITSTILTLFIVPVVYSLLDDLETKFLSGWTSALTRQNIFKKSSK
jgi:HAE1 family hydrophobic/amphiphilic exporter-1